uniref:GDT1 family protein n=2 Tax=Magnoliopsida TaxID=3398 RepID=A0A803QQD2_CANSA
MSSVVQGFTKSLAMTVLSEIGDKTFFAAAILAMRHPRRLVLTGCLSALVVMTILSAVVGWAAPNLISRKLTHHVTTLLFFGFGLWSLWDAFTGEGEAEDLAEVEAKLDADFKSNSGTAKTNSKDVDEKKKQKRPFLTQFFSPILLKAFSITFFGEWGDKSQLATIGLAADENPIGVVLGGIFWASARIFKRVGATHLALSKWNRCQFGKLDNRIARLEGHLNSIQSLLSGSRVWAEELETRKSLNEALRCRALYWQQRSRLSWIKDGDKCSKFFTTAIIKNRRNEIEAIMNKDGVWLSNRKGHWEGILGFLGKYLQRHDIWAGGMLRPPDLGPLLPPGAKGFASVRGNSISNLVTSERPTHSSRKGTQVKATGRTGKKGSLVWVPKPQSALPCKISHGFDGLGNYSSKFSLRFEKTYEDMSFFDEHSNVYKGPVFAIKDAKVNCVSDGTLDEPMASNEMEKMCVLRSLLLIPSRGLNAMNVTLIPKVPSPKKVSQFKPISLYNVVYKVSNIIPECDIRQGDPLSPYLFIWAANNLSRILENALDIGAIRGIKLSRNGPRLSHLLFADD